MDTSKRQNLPRALPEGLWSGLWVVATPIGNLDDLSPRATAALRAADAILCEDTRRTSRLTSALGIQTSLVRLDAHSGPAQIQRQVERLVNGENLALVSDAGTPGISDPGAAMVAAAREAGIRVVPIPGPSAVATLLSASGFQQSEFAFMGFFPRKEGDARRLLGQISESGLIQIYVWYESPERIVKSLEWIAAELPSARVIAAKELTKIHESFFTGDSVSVRDAIRAETEREGRVGEWCIALKLEPPSDQRDAGKSSDWVKALQCLLDARVSASEAASQVSQHFGVPKKTVYEAGLRLSGKKIT